MTDTSAQPSRRARIVAASLGAMFVIAAAWLLWDFVERPVGELIWLPGTWRGAPLILGACTFGVYGVLLVVLRRFSLWAMLLCTVLSAALTGGLTAYVQSFVEIQTKVVEIELPEEFQADYISWVNSTLTENRIKSFLQKRQAQEPDFNGQPDFRRVFVTAAPTVRKDTLRLAVNFEFQTYLQPRGTDLRVAVWSYVAVMGFAEAYYRIGPRDPSIPMSVESAYHPLQSVAKGIHRFLFLGCQLKAFPRTPEREIEAVLGSGFPVTSLDAQRFNECYDKITALRWFEAEGGEAEALKWKKVIDWCEMTNGCLNYGYQFLSH